MNSSARFHGRLKIKLKIDPPYRYSNIINSRLVYFHPILQMVSLEFVWLKTSDCRGLLIFCKQYSLTHQSCSVLSRPRWNSRHVLQWSIGRMEKMLFWTTESSSDSKTLGYHRNKIKKIIFQLHKQRRFGTFPGVTITRIKFVAEGAAVKDYWYVASRQCLPYIYCLTILLRYL